MPTGRWTGSSTTATATATASSSTPAPPTWAGQPGLEGLLGRHQLRRRHARRGSDRPGRGAGLRRTPPTWPSRTSAPKRGRRRRRLLGRAGRAPPGGLQRGVLDAGQGLLRARPRRRQATDRLAGLEHGPLPVDRHRRRGQGRRGRAPPDGPEMFWGSGSDARPSYRRLQPDELPQRLDLAARQRDLRRRPDALRLRRRGPAGHGRDPRAAEWFRGRLPELFSGFDRAEFTSRSATRLVLAAGLGFGRAVPPAAHAASI